MPNTGKCACMAHDPAGANEQMILRTLFPFPCNNEGSSHLPFALTRHLSQTSLHAEMWVMTRGPQARERFVRAAFPGRSWSVVVRANKLLRPDNSWATQVLEHRFKRAFRKGDLALVNRGCSLELIHALGARGHLVFLERVNVMDHMAKRILEDAFARAGWPVEHHYTQDVLDGEQVQAEAAHFIFSANPAVTASLIERGIPEKKILKCSYGWEPERFATTAGAIPRSGGINVLFVGHIGVRKGAHILLEAWSRAGINGRLVLLGNMDPLIAKYCAGHLERRDVVHLPYIANPAPAYRSADIFAFPTLEEGGPLVSYEAMGCGLPIVTSPMGAGGIVRHGREGLIVDPHDQEALIAALQELSTDADLRRTMGNAGQIRAEEFTWDKVAQRRYEMIMRAVGSGP
jgi:glycosyltransferase involved in cell wall biosynthesis